MHTEVVHYECEGIQLQGYVAYDPEIKAKRPGIIVAHAWKGQDDFARQKAQALAEMGYVGFAADVYGEGRYVESSEEALKLMLPLFLDRAALRKRILAAFDAIKEHPHVDPEMIGAIGFCFGGLTVIELLRSGAEVRGVVSFHGVLGNALKGHKAKTLPNADKIEGALLMLHGYKDPLVSTEDIRAIQEEFTKAGIDWQMNIYGKAYHAFTNPDVHDEKEGLVYNPQAAMRSWQTMCDFFEEIFS